MDIEAVRDVLSGALEDYISSPEVQRASTGTIEAAARYIALHLDERYSIAERLSRENRDVWNALGDLWTALAAVLAPSASLQDEHVKSLVGFATALAKLERNLIAGLQDFQVRAHSQEPLIRRIIFNITTFARIEDEKYFTFQTVIVQLLSNLISPISTSSSGFAERCLGIYLSGNREEDIVLRLLDSQDVKVTESTLRMLNNLLRDSDRQQQKLISPSGQPWLSKILGHMDSWHDGEDHRFSLGATLIHHFLDNDQTAKLYHLLGDETEAITPSQSTLLKLIDADLSSANAWLYTTDATSTSYTFSVRVFNELSRYCLISMRSGQDDARLPKVFEGLILVAEALSSIGLKAQERKDRIEAPLLAVDEILGKGKSPEAGIIKSLVVADLLRQLDSFLPRVKPGQASAKPTPPELAPVSNIKRDLVRLLGILAFDDIAVGDQVRDCEGVQLLLSMTEVDENNPYLREHALFAVRNLMKDNPANQAVIAEMDPVGVVSESGELLPLPERLRRQQRSTGTNGEQGRQGP